MLYKWQEENLRKYRPKLVENIEAESLLNHMEAESIITKRQAAVIKNPYRDCYAQVEMLLDHLNRRPPKDYDSFLKCLKMSNQSHIVDRYLIQGATGDDPEEEQAREPENDYCEPVQYQPSSKPCSEESRYMAPGQIDPSTDNKPEEDRLGEQLAETNLQDVSEIYEEIPDSVQLPCGNVQYTTYGEQEVDEEELERSLLEAVKYGIKGPIRVLPSTDSMVKELLSKRKSGLGLYQMRGKYKGKGIIISVKHVKGNIERQGTEQDKDLLDKLFTDIGYTIFTYTDADNLTAQGIMEKMQTFCEHLSDEDLSTVVCLLSHGDNGVVYGTDGETVELNSILSLLNNQNCPKMQNKPKMIFTQACRGNITDRGVAMSDSKPERQYEYVHPQVHPTKQSLQPLCTDFLIGSATQKDNRAWRNAAGSYYIKALVIVFMKFAHLWSVPQMLTKVNDLVSRTKIKASADMEVCQMPTFETQLRKDLYLFPGIADK